jgi:hypothetical protein
MMNFAREVRFRTIELYLFTVQFQYLGDWRRAMEDRSWVLRDYIVLFKEYGGFSDIGMTDMNFIDVHLMVIDPKSRKCLAPRDSGKNTSES